MWRKEKTEIIADKNGLIPVNEKFEVQGNGNFESVSDTLFNNSGIHGLLDDGLLF